MCYVVPILNSFFAHDGWRQEYIDFFSNHTSLDVADTTIDNNEGQVLTTRRWDHRIVGDSYKLRGESRAQIDMEKEQRLTEEAGRLTNDPR